MASNAPITIGGHDLRDIAFLHHEWRHADPELVICYEPIAERERTRSLMYGAPNWHRSIEVRTIRIRDIHRYYDEWKRALYATAYGRSPLHQAMFPRQEGKSERARAVEEAMQMMQTIEPGAVWRHIDWAVFDKALEDTMTTKADVAAEAEKPTNRAEQVLLTDLNARRRDRDYQRAKQKEHADIAKSYKTQADKHAVAVKEVEASMKKSGFNIPEDAGK